MFIFFFVNITAIIKKRIQICIIPIEQSARYEWQNKGISINNKQNNNNNKILKNIYSIQCIQCVRYLPIKFRFQSIRIRTLFAVPYICYFLFFLSSSAVLYDFVMGSGVLLTLLYFINFSVCHDNIKVI